MCSRVKSNLLIRNSIGAHAGSYSIYRALSIAMGQLRPDWRPDLTNTHVSLVMLPAYDTNDSHLSPSLLNRDGLVMERDEGRRVTRRTGRSSRLIPGEPCRRRSGPRWVTILTVLLTLRNTLKASMFAPPSHRPKPTSRSKNWTSSLERASSPSMAISSSSRLN